MASAHIAAEAGALLIENGQTTESVRVAIQRLQPGLEVAIRWGEVIFWSPGEPCSSVAATPAAVDIGRVEAIEQGLDRLAGLSDEDGAAQLRRWRARPAVSVARFTFMAAAGATSLAVIFGAVADATLPLVFVSAGLAALLRRGLGRLSSNPFLQPFAAAILAGGIAGLTVALQWPVSDRLLAVCPCMVLVPGPHLLNGSIDLVRARIPLGSARLAYAGLILLAICAGLMLGLAAWGTTLAPSGPARAVPLLLDVAAAGVAVAAYSSFFNMPWRIVPIPMAIGMAAHAFRWMLLHAGASVQTGAFAACLLVGTVASPLAQRLRIPFGALAFASVVSLMPGVFLFQAAADASALISSRAGDATAQLMSLAANSLTAALVLIAITTGVIGPKLCGDHLSSWRRSGR